MLNINLLSVENIFVSVCVFQYLHRHTSIPEPFYPAQADECPNSHSVTTQIAHWTSETNQKQISSQTATATTDRPPDRPCDRQADSQKVVRNTTCGARRKSHGLDNEVEKEIIGEGQAKAEDEPKLAGSQQMCHTLQPHKSFTLGNTFAGIFVSN